MPAVPSAYAFEWNGTITNDDVDQVLAKFEHGLETHDSVRALTRVEQLTGIRPSALFHRGTYLRMKVLGLKKIERYALVTNSSWLTRYVDTAKRLTNIDVRVFPLDQEQQAWSWLDAQPASSMHA